ncbi:hypothetical protein NKH77_12575 [Streptomyces sp. M19]
MALQASSPGSNRRQSNGESGNASAGSAARVPARRASPTRPPTTPAPVRRSPGRRTRKRRARPPTTAGGRPRGPSGRRGGRPAAGRRAGRPKGRQQQDGSAQPAQAAQSRRRARAANRRPSGRERHDEKITVYVSAEELMDLEHARLVLRGEHGLAVDRGRIVREAVAVVLADLESRGDASILVRRLRGR